ncbi:hypothetical protein BDQ17DRAFT_1417672 [Cyathus striatus]|nr:hypothetical protein BDQ17DRAFT_1417672 [Cyathus striatus]
MSTHSYNGHYNSHATTESDNSTQTTTHGGVSGHRDRENRDEDVSGHRNRVYYNHRPSGDSYTHHYRQRRQPQYDSWLEEMDNVEVKISGLQSRENYTHQYRQGSHQGFQEPQQNPYAGQLPREYESYRRVANERGYFQAPQGSPALYPQITEQNHSGQQYAQSSRTYRMGPPTYLHTGYYPQPAPRSPPPIPNWFNYYPPPEQQQTPFYPQSAAQHPNPTMLPAPIYPPLPNYGPPYEQQWAAQDPPPARQAPYPTTPDYGRDRGYGYNNPYRRRDGSQGQWTLGDVDEY